jgi:hypothetical protein
VQSVQEQKLVLDCSRLIVLGRSRPYLPCTVIFPVHQHQFHLYMMYQYINGSTETFSFDQLRNLQKISPPIALAHTDSQAPIIMSRNSLLSSLEASLLVSVGSSVGPLGCHSLDDSSEGVSEASEGFGLPLLPPSSLGVTPGAGGCRECLAAVGQRSNLSKALRGTIANYCKCARPFQDCSLLLIRARALWRFISRIAVRSLYKRRTEIEQLSYDSSFDLK